MRLVLVLNMLSSLNKDIIIIIIIIIIFIIICLSWPVIGSLSPCFVCRGQYWLVYLPVLSVVNNIGCYISLVCVP